LSVYAGRTETIITGAFIVVGKDFVGFIDFFEAGFSIVMIADIRVIFTGELAECFLNVVFASSPGDPQ